MGRDPPYYESALNRDSLDKSADNEEKKRMGKRESLPPASLGYFEAMMETASTIQYKKLEKLKRVDEAKNILALPLNEEFLKGIAGPYICSRSSLDPSPSKEPSSTSEEIIKMNLKKCSRKREEKGVETRSRETDVSQWKLLDSKKGGVNRSAS